MTGHSTHCIILIIQFVKSLAMNLLQLQSNELLNTSIVRYKIKLIIVINFWQQFIWLGITVTAIVA